jgi:hypothetical protein
VRYAWTAETRLMSVIATPRTVRMIQLAFFIEAPGSIASPTAWTIHQVGKTITGEAPF